MESIRELLARLARTVDAPDPERAEHLWAAYRAGGPDAEAAFGTLMGWYGQLIYRRVRGFVRSDAADDVFQEVVTQLHRHRRRLADFRHALRWARAVAVSLSLRALRTERRRLAREHARGVTPSAVLPEPPDAQLDAVREAVARLPPKEREAVALVFFEGQTRQAAAAAVGVHRDTLAKRIDSALARLRSMLPAGVIVAGGVDATLAVPPPPPDRLVSLAAAALETAGSATRWGWLAPVSVGVLLVGVTAGVAGVLVSAPPTALRPTALNRPERAVGFGVGGVVVTELPTKFAPRVALAPDGRLVVAGGSGVHVARFHPDGTPDTGFNGTGTRTASGRVGLTPTATDVEVLPDGRVVVAGLAGDGRGGLYVERLLADGTPDARFGGDGVVVIDDGNGRLRGLNDLAVQPDEKVIVVGYGPVGNTWAVARLTAAGLPDAAFGTGGWAADVVGGERKAVPAAVAVQADGRVVVCGRALGPEGDHDLMVVRYHADGTPDVEFGGGGGTTVDFGPVAGRGRTSDTPTALAVLPDGRIVVAGTCERVGADSAGSRLAVVRLTPGGVPDATFSADGFADATPAGWEFAVLPRVAALPDSRLVVGASGGNQDSVGPAGAVGRLTADGSPDPTFGRGGWRPCEFTPDGLGLLQDVLAQPDGKLVAVGVVKVGNRPPRVALARFNPDGSLDTKP